MPHFSQVSSAAVYAITLLGAVACLFVWLTKRGGGAQDRMLSDVRAPPPSPCFVPELPHFMLVELRQALILYQNYHMLLLTLAGTALARGLRGAALRDQRLHRGAYKLEEREGNPL